MRGQGREEEGREEEGKGEERKRGEEGFLKSLSLRTLTPS